MVVAARDGRPHRHRVDQQAHHRFRAGHLGRPPRDRGAEGDIMLAGQPHQQLREGALQHGVDGGVTRARQLAKRPRGLARAPETMQRLARPSPNRSGGPTRVGVSKPANTSRQAAWAASRSRPASQVTNLRYGAGRGQPLPVIAGEYLPQQDRQRPAIEHDVVIGQHKPVPICCGADQRRPKRPAGRPDRRPRRVRRRTPAGSAHRHRRRRRRPARHTARAPRDRPG